MHFPRGTHLPPTFFLKNRTVLPSPLGQQNFKKKMKTCRKKFGRYGSYRAQKKGSLTENVIRCILERKKSFLLKLPEEIDFYRENFSAFPPGVSAGVSACPGGNAVSTSLKLKFPLPP